jgi:hypothetical protein
LHCRGIRCSHDRSHHRRTRNGGLRPRSERRILTKDLNKNRHHHQNVGTLTWIRPLIQILYSNSSRFIHVWVLRCDDHVLCWVDVDERGLVWIALREPYRHWDVVCITFILDRDGSAQKEKRFGKRAGTYTNEEIESC